MVSASQDWRLECNPAVPASFAGPIEVTSPQTRGPFRPFASIFKRGDKPSRRKMSSSSSDSSAKFWERPSSPPPPYQITVVGPAYRVEGYGSSVDLLETISSPSPTASASSSVSSFDDSACWYDLLASDIFDPEGNERRVYGQPKLLSLEDAQWRERKKREHEAFFDRLEAERVRTESDKFATMDRLLRGGGI